LEGLIIIKIRTEQPSDYDKVESLVKTSFATNDDGDATTHDYLNELRAKDVFIPELSLVAEKDGKIIGQVVLYKTDITTPTGKHTELVLSPICVHPNYFRQGVARAMIDEVLQKAKDMGFGVVFLCGDPIIYGKLGFVPSYKYNIFHKTDAKAEWSMVCELYNGALEGISGTVNTI
jgi:predicted N-acetyltransferase YhbS